jgi:hypothetical protein
LTLTGATVGTCPGGAGLAAGAAWSSLLLRAMASPLSWLVRALMNSAWAGSSNTKSPPSDPGRLPKAGVCSDTLDTAGAT